jgi:hypothetical protein
MIVSRIAASAEAILQEFERTKILDLLNRAIDLATNRGELKDNQYAAQAQQIREQASEIMQRDVLKIIPNDIASILIDSAYSAALPFSIAKVLFSGVSQVKTSSMSSSELSIYATAAGTLILELNSMLTAFKKFGIDQMSIPPGSVSLDILVPRSVFNNNAESYNGIIRSFLQVLSAFQEAAGGPKDGLDLVYTSTTDPVLGAAVILAAITPILTFYDKLLDIAKKQIEFRNVIKTLRDSPVSGGLGMENMEQRMREINVRSVQEATEQTLASIVVAQDDAILEGRRSELKNAISLRSHVVINSIANGARLSVTLESLVKLKSDCDEAQLDYSAVAGLISHNKVFERAVEDNLRVLNQHVPLLDGISGEQPQS